MSRTGTSLLYQLLYNHKKIFFPKYRIQFVCSPPFGWPLINNNQQRNIFDLLSKTTIPINSSKSTSWHSMQIEFLDKVFNNDLNLFRKNKIEQNKKLKLDECILTLNDLLKINVKNKEFICLHDDHSYLMGCSDLKYSGIDKILTTLRNPLDMIASKKNMLIFHSFGQNNPSSVKLREEVLEKELKRAIFSLLTSSYEYSISSNFLPIYFEHLKSKFRYETMIKVSNYLEVEFTNAMMTEDTDDDPSFFNELMFASSSLKHISKGKSNRIVGSYKVSLVKEELSFLKEIMDKMSFTDYSDDPFLFYKEFGRFWEDFPFEKFEDLKNWFTLYRNKEYQKVFDLYSLYNYGSSNFEHVFKG